jgi:LPXTG-motif cell wall-anchored protein
MKAIICLLGALMLCSLAAAMPVLPTGYYGYVKDASGSPIQGVEVEVYDSGSVLVGRSNPTNAQGLYSLNVVWDNPATGADEGVSSGEQISFFINQNRVAGAIVGSQGSNNYLDLQSGLAQDSARSAGLSEDAETIAEPQPELDGDGQSGAEHKAAANETQPGPAGATETKESLKAPETAESSEVSLIAEPEESGEFGNKGNTSYIILGALAIIIIGGIIYFRKR